MNSKKKRVLIVANFCDYGQEKTNNRFNYLAELFASRGFDVTLLTSSFDHRGKRQRQEINDEKLSYRTGLIYEPGYRKNVSLKRFYSHYVFGKNLRKYLNGIEKPDLVYCAIPSLDAARSAARYSEKNKLPFVIDIQDLWPEAFKLVFKLPIISDLLFWPMARAANYAYRAADKVVAVSETYKCRGLKVNKKDKEGLSVFLGTELSEFDRKAALHTVEKPEGEIWVGYAGTLGHSYNIEIIIDALNLIADKLTQKVVFKVYGDGPYLERFREYARGSKVKVDFLGRLDYSLMVANLVKCDIAVNPIAKGAAQSIINKHADYAAAGLAVVNTQECPEYRNLIENFCCGINCGVTDTEKVASALLELITDDKKRRIMGENSRRLAEEKFDRKTSYRLLIDSLEVLLAGF